MKLAIFRVDASERVGFGHLVRCLSFAHSLKQHGWKIVVACDGPHPTVKAMVTNRGFACEDISTEGRFEQLLTTLKPDWLVVDHYDIDISWEQTFRPFVKGLLVIDDQGTRPHDCDIYVNPDYEDLDVHDLLPPTCQTFMGKNYLFFAQDFLKLRKGNSAREGSLNTVLISLGGSDVTGLTSLIVRAFAQVRRVSLSLSVVAGPANPDAANIRGMCQAHDNVTFYETVPSLGPLLAQTDFAVISGGMTMWEACYLATPSLVIVAADNQRHIVAELHNNRCIHSLGWHKDISSEELQTCIDSVMERYHDFFALGARAGEMWDENGTRIDDVIQAMSTV